MAWRWSARSLRRAISIPSARFIFDESETEVHEVESDSTHNIAIDLVTANISSGLWTLPWTNLGLLRGFWVHVEIVAVEVLPTRAYPIQRIDLLIDCIQVQRLLASPAVLNPEGWI